jgi:hypothetical protein
MTRQIFKMLFIVLAVALSAFAIQAQPRVSIADTLLERGKTSSLPVLCSFQTANNDNIQFTIQYTRSTVAILEAEASQFGISKPTLSQQVDFPNGWSQVTISSIVTSGMWDKSPLINIKVEPLAGNDSSAQVSIVGVKVNDTPIAGLLTDTSLIKINNSIPITGTPNEYLSPAYPNPVGLKGCKFNYSILDDNEVTFTVFNSIGKQVFTTTLASQLPGDYTFTWEFLNSDISSGSYTMVMKTKRDVYGQQFMVVK